MSPSSKAAWINLVLKLTPIIISMVKPELAPISSEIAQSIGGAENSYGTGEGEAKLKQVTTDVKAQTKGIDNVTVGDIRKIVSATVDTVNLIHETKKKVNKSR